MAVDIYKGCVNTGEDNMEEVAPTEILALEKAAGFILEINQAQYRERVKTHEDNV